VTASSPFDLQFCMLNRESGRRCGIATSCCSCMVHASACLCAPTGAGASFPRQDRTSPRPRPPLRRRRRRRSTAASARTPSSAATRNPVLVLGEGNCPLAEGRLCSSGRWPVHAAAAQRRPAGQTAAWTEPCRAAPHRPGGSTSWAGGVPSRTWSVAVVATAFGRWRVLNKRCRTATRPSQGRRKVTAFRSTPRPEQCSQPTTHIDRQTRCVTRANLEANGVTCLPRASARPQLGLGGGGRSGRSATVICFAAPTKREAPAGHEQRWCT
jgi:hypothetical protein